MKTYKQLNKSEQKQAINQEMNNLLEAIIQDGLRFDDVKNEDKLQAKIDKAFEKADKMQTPWFVREIMLEDKYIKESLMGMAECVAEDNTYLEDNEIMPVRLKKGSAK